MSNDTGRGNWPEERPTRASVRHLHADEADGSSTTTTEEWYETERLAGQITGGGRTAAPAFPHSGAPAVLEWRHAELAPAPSALQRLGRSLANRGHRVVSKTQARRPWLTMLTTRGAVAPPTVEPPGDKPTPDGLAVEPGAQRTVPLGSADAAPHRLEWRSSPAPKARREHPPRPARRWLTGIALVLTVAAVAVIAITSHSSTRAVYAPLGSFATATSRPRVALIATAETVLGVLGTVEHQARTMPARQRIIARVARPHGRPHDTARPQHSQPVRPHSSSPAPQAPAAAPATSSAGGGGTASTGASSSQTSAAPSTGSSQSGGSGTSGGFGSSSGVSDQASSASASSSAPVTPTGATGALGPIGSPNG